MDDDTLAELADGKLGPESLRSLGVHIDQCVDCRRLVAEMAKERSTEPEDASVDGDPDGKGKADSDTFGLGRYELVRILGAGSMGSVWLAHDLVERRDVALKIIHAELAKRPQARARFLREAAISRRLQNDHIVTAFDEGITSTGEPYIVMECLEGETLRQRLLDRGRLSCFDTAWVVFGVCRALAAAHNAGLVHRDLKPENVFIARRSGGQVVKVLDFGLAKVSDVLSDPLIRLTPSGALLGTPAYMSPEQAQGSATVDHRSDLWAVGVLVFECLCGVRPFAAKERSALIRKILIDPPPLPSITAPDAGLSAQVDAWMARALACDKGLRFSSAEELSLSFAEAASAASLDMAAVSHLAAHRPS